MHAKRVVLGAVLAISGLLGLSSTASAVTIDFSGSVTSCTPTCNSFAFLATGSELSGSVIFDDAALADGTWTGGDVLGLSFTVFNPARPCSQRSAAPGDRQSFHAGPERETAAGWSSRTVSRSRRRGHLLDRPP